MALAGEVGGGGLQPIEVVVAEVAVDHEQGVQVGVADHPAELAGLAVGVEEGHDRADAGAGQPADDPVRRVRGEQPDPRALPTPEASSPLASAGGLRLGGRVGEAHVAEHRQLLVAVGVHAVADQRTGRRRVVREARWRDRSQGLVLHDPGGAVAPVLVLEQALVELAGVLAGELVA